MTLRPLSLIAILLLLPAQLWAAPLGQVQAVYFKTAAPPPVFVVPAELKPYESMFRSGLATMSEGMLVNGALSLGGPSLGLTTQQSSNLNALLVATYSHIDADPAFLKLDSALPYCFSPQRNTNGHYFISLPEKTGPQTPFIVFLHGYGGNFQFYVWALRKSLPEAIILCPSWNESWYGGSPRYLADAIIDAKARFRLTSTNQWLMGISAGGRAGFAVQSQVANLFRGYICLASAPESPDIPRLKKSSRILMINGSQDPMVPATYARKQAAWLKKQVPTLRYEELPSDHFFILSQRERCFQLVRQFIQIN